MMASDDKKTKPDLVPKKAAAPKDKVISSTDVSKAADPPKAADTPKTEGGETAGAAPKGYSRGEGQKPVTQAYKDNWNAIFAKKKKRR
jgi:hypothetical protein